MLAREDYLFESGGLLSMGQRAERVFGKNNFLELYAVFSSPVLYRVETQAKRELGSLEQNFVDRFVEDMSTFLLGGRASMVVSLNHTDHLVRVRAARQDVEMERLRAAFLGLEVCQQMKEILVSTDEHPCLVDEHEDPREFG